MLHLYPIKWNIKVTNEIMSLLIPTKPDFIPNQNVHKAIAIPNDVGSEDFGESLNGHGETGNGPDADVEHFPTMEKKGSLSYADAARGTKRYVSFE